VRRIVERGTVLVTAGAFLAVAVACAPGLSDPLIVRFRGSPFPPWLLWGLGDAVALPKLVVTWTVAPLLVALAAVLVALRGRPSRSRLELAVLLTALVGWSALANITALWPPLGRDAVAGLAAVALPCALLALALDRAALDRLFLLLAPAALVIALYSFCQHLGLDFLGWDPRHSEPDRTIASFGNPDFLAAWLVALVPVFVYGAIRNPRRAVAWSLAAGFVVGVVVFTYTRAAWVALLVELLAVAFWLRPRLSGPAIGAALLGFLLVCVAVNTQPTRQGVSLLGRIHETVQGDKSISVRLVLWREALAVIRSHPLLGTGPESFSYAAMPFRGTEPGELKSRIGLSGDPHDAWLEIAAGQGLPALLLALGAVLVAARSGWRGGGAGPCAVIAGAGLFVAHGLVRLTLPSLWLGCLLAVICVGRDDAPGDGGSRGSLVAIILGLVASLLVARGCAAVIDGEYRANMARMLGSEALERGGRAGAELLRGALAAFDQARAELDGIRQGRAALDEARLLERVLARVSPLEAGGPQRELVEGVGPLMLARAFEAVASNRIDPYRWHDLARMLVVASERTSDPSRAQALLEQALTASRQGCALDPHNAALAADLARRLARAGRFAEADAAFRASLEEAPDQVAVRLDHARMLFEWGKTQGAEDELREVERLDPGNADAMKMLYEEARRRRDGRR
jgi:O-antigen ligase